MDLIIMLDRAIRFNFHNRNNTGKSFASIDGCVGVASIKSNLSSQGLKDVLANIASLPNKSPPNFHPFIVNTHYDKWPYKIVYASDGVNLETAKRTLQSYYEENPDIPFNKRPDIIHVLGKYLMILVREGEGTRDGQKLEPNTYYCQEVLTEEFGLPYVISQLHGIAEISNHMLLSYDWIYGNLPLRVKNDFLKETNLSVT